MACRIDFQGLQGQRKAEFLQALLSEINGLKKRPEEWAKVQARAEEIKRREDDGVYAENGRGV